MCPILTVQRLATANGAINIRIAASAQLYLYIKECWNPNPEGKTQSAYIVPQQDRQKVKEAIMQCYKIQEPKIFKYGSPHFCLSSYPGPLPIASP